MSLHNLIEDKSFQFSALEGISTLANGNSWDIICHQVFPIITFPYSGMEQNHYQDDHFLNAALSILHIFHAFKNASQYVL